MKLIRGDDTDITVTLLQDDAPFDLSQITRIDLHAKDQSRVVIQLSTTDNSIEIVGCQIVLHFDRALTHGALWRQAAYDMQIVIGAKVQTVLSGTIELVHDITEVQLE